ncbi:MAG: hypothetical protein KF892_23540 [Rhizobacter sp.]|nr:hypothetical protein [Rhizobacter sp.]
MKWEPHDVIRLVALIGAIALFCLGGAMMWQGVAAEGTIDLKSSVISGSLKTGSAGLFIAFLAFVVIVSVLAGAHKSPQSQPQQATDRSRFKRLLPVFFVLLVALAASVALASAGYAIFIGLSLLCGLLLVIVVVALLTFLEEER